MGVKDEQQRLGHTRRAGSAARTTGYRSDSEFINLELDKEQTAAYRQWREDIANVIDLWTELIEGGYRVNTKYDDYSSSCAAFIIPGEGAENVGFILTGRGGNAYRAVSEAIFKHYEVLHGDWRSRQARDPFDRDADF